MLLEFEDERGQRRTIGEPDSFIEAVKMSRDFLARIPQFNVYYMEWLVGEDMWCLDFGSSRQFITLSNLKEGLHNELNSYYQKGVMNGNV